MDETSCSCWGLGALLMEENVCCGYCEQQKAKEAEKAEKEEVESGAEG